MREVRERGGDLLKHDYCVKLREWHVETFH